MENLNKIKSFIRSNLFTKVPNIPTIYYFIFLLITPRHKSQRWYLKVSNFVYNKKNYVPK